MHDGNDIPKTVISREYSSEWKVGDEPYYPVNDEKNGALYAEVQEAGRQGREGDLWRSVWASISIMIWMR